MKVSTVSIVLAIFCTLSSWRSAEGGDTIAIAVGDSTAIAVNKGSDDTGSKAVVLKPSTPQPSRPQPSTPSNAGSSSGSNDKNPESDKIETTTMSSGKWWLEKLEKALDGKYGGMDRNDPDRAINDLKSSIQEALAKTGLSGTMIAELNFALKTLLKFSGNYDASVKEVVYHKALDKWISFLCEMPA